MADKSKGTTGQLLLPEVSKRRNYSLISKMPKMCVIPPLVPAPLNAVLIEAN